MFVTRHGDELSANTTYSRKAPGEIRVDRSLVMGCQGIPGDSEGKRERQEMSGAFVRGNGSSVRKGATTTPETVAAVVGRCGPDVVRMCRGMAWRAAMGSPRGARRRNAERGCRADCTRIARRGMVVRVLRAGT